MFVVVYDACVLCPAPLRDFLLHLATTDLFAARWTGQIHEEWIRNLLENRSDLSRDKLERTRAAMDGAIPDCLVIDYEPLIEGLSLPDPNDRHVLAAAIKAGAQLIVTFNLKDFPASILEPFGIEALHPDVFAEHQMTLHEGSVVSTVKNQRSLLSRPSITADQLLETLAANGLVVTAERLAEFKDVI
ncbi:PIN domain-containing protein [Salinisphaera sp.]|uniref:PIN domain-containing protein n=1 Tax=Salinisphaera sp. TaxID=1914330 RepID=UPI000C60A98F|nr:PIN domain-containing protein [Salinisphaera sp.]MBS62579.1 PIN domain-containing protein [Salinisphaera sp.]